MAIYGVGYRALDYRPTGTWSRLWPIAWQEYRGLFRRRLGVTAFVICLAPGLFNLVAMLLQTGLLQLGVGQERIQRAAQLNPRLDPSQIEFFLTSALAEPPPFVVFLVLTSLVSCRAIAKDRQSGAFEIYWTRGVGPRGYFLAKWLGSFLLCATVFVAVPLVIWVLAILMSQS